MDTSELGGLWLLFESVSNYFTSLYLSFLVCSIGSSPTYRFTLQHEVSLRTVPAREESRLPSLGVRQKRVYECKATVNSTALRMSSFEKAEYFFFF